MADPEGGRGSGPLPPFEILITIKLRENIFYFLVLTRDLPRWTPFPKLDPPLRGFWIPMVMMMKRRVVLMTVSNKCTIYPYIFKVPPISAFSAVPRFRFAENATV